MRRTLGRAFRLQSALLILLTLAGVAAQGAVEEIRLLDVHDNEINVQIMPALGDFLCVWFVDHEVERPQFEGMLRAINRAGIEVWRVDLLADYFLPRSSENVRSLPGDGVAAVIDAAHSRSDKTVLLAAYDRMPLPLLRGVRQWQSVFRGKSRLAGAVLFYPNLFGPPPVAGRDPELAPILSATNIPVTVYQPAKGPQRWRIKAVVNALWAGGSPAYVYLVPDVRDWFFMHPPDQDPAERAATADVPRKLFQFARLMDASPKPAGPVETLRDQAVTEPALGVVAFGARKRAPALNLEDASGSRIGLGDYGGRVTLVNFWATWCPPCVEEIPSLNRLARRYPDETFAVVSVDFRESQRVIREFAERVAIEFPVLLDRDGRTSLAWKVFSFPSSFLIDRDGYIRYSVNRAIDWDTPEVWALVDGLISE